MKISATILAHKLKTNYTFQHRKNLTDTLHLERVLFYCNGDSIQEHKIYICDNEHAPTEEIAIPDTAILMYIGRPEKDLAAKKANIFQFSEHVEVYKLFNSIQQIFEYYEKWETQLQKILEKSGDIRELLDCSFKIFHNPIIVNSYDFFVISYSGIIDEKPELSRLVDPDALFEYNNEFNKNEHYIDLKFRSGAFLFPNYITGSNSLCVNLFDHDKCAYRVTMVEELSRFQSEDAALLEYLSAFVHEALGRHHMVYADMGYRLDRLLSDLLSKEAVSMEAAEQAFGEFGWMDDHHYCCINLKVAAIDLQNMTVRFICSHIEHLLEHSCAFQFENNIAVFVNLTLFEGDCEDVLNKIIYFLRDSFIKAGFSNEFTGFSRMLSYYRQAAIALEVGSRRNSFKWVHRFDDIALDYMLEQCCGELPEELVCSRKLLELKIFDQEHHTDYFNTLSIYVKNHLNAVQSAKLLYIHRSTFLYRMEKIREILNLNLDDYNTLLYVMITLKKLEMNEKKEE